MTQQIDFLIGCHVRFLSRVEKSSNRLKEILCLTTDRAQRTENQRTKKFVSINIFEDVEHRRRIIDVVFHGTFDIGQNR